MVGPGSIRAAGMAGADISAQLFVFRQLCSLLFVIIVSLTALFLVYPPCPPLQ